MIKKFFYTIFFLVLIHISMNNATVRVAHNGVAIQPGDSFIVAAGAAMVGVANQFMLTRYTTSGSLDSSFGALNGYVLTSIGDDAQAEAVALDNTGKIMVAGSAFINGVTKSIVARYTSAGVLDTTYGSGLGYTAITAGGDGAQAYAIKIDSNGNSLIAGTTVINAIRYVFVARFDSSGALDITFNGSGYVTQLIGTASCGHALVIQNDGKIVVGGQTVSNGVASFALWRFNVDGSLDDLFGSNGVVTTIFGANAGIRALALQPDGAIIAAGFSDNHVAAARYLSIDGSLDSSFGVGGKINTVIGVRDQINAIAVQDDGAFLLAGSTDDEFLVLRYIFDGNLDTSFGSVGYVETAISYESQATGLAIQADGKIVVLGGSEDSCAAARYNTDGTLDNDFGFSGTVRIPTPTEVYSPRGHAFAYDITTQDVITPNTMQDVTFNTTISLDGWTHSDGSALFTCLLPGKYSIEYDLIVTDSSPVPVSSLLSAHILRNGAEASGSQSVIGMGALLNQVFSISRCCIVNCFSGDEIKIQFTGSSTTNQLVAGLGVGVSKPSAVLTIIRISE